MHKKDFNILDCTIHLKYKHGGIIMCTRPVVVLFGVTSINLCSTAIHCALNNRSDLHHAPADGTLLWMYWDIVCISPWCKYVTLWWHVLGVSLVQYFHQVCHLWGTRCKEVCRGWCQLLHQHWWPWGHLLLYHRWIRYCWTENRTDKGAAYPIGRHKNTWHCNSIILYTYFHDTH